MIGVPRFIADNPTDPGNRLWLENQITNLENDNTQIAARIVGLRNTLEANASQIRQLQVLLSKAK
jgi:hypothetical protein